MLSQQDFAGQWIPWDLLRPVLPPALETASQAPARVHPHPHTAGSHADGVLPAGSLRLPLPLLD